MKKFVSLPQILALFLLFAAIPSGGFSAWTWAAGIRWFYFFFLAFVFSVALIPAAVFLAHKTSAIDLPDERRMHLKPTPRFGGFALWLGFLAVLFRNFEFSSPIVGIMLSSTIVYILGALDDIKKLSASSRLFFQFLAAAIAVYLGLRISFTAHSGFLGEGLAWVISMIWLVGITNAFNFMDGIDGLAASMGLVCSLCFLAIAVNTNQFKVAVVSASLSGVCLGFLRYNWNPAKIFLGDGGSTFIGFVLGCMAILITWGHDNNLNASAGPLLIMGIPIFDLIYTTISRIKNGKVRNVREWLEYAGKDHFHHRLISIGFNVKTAVLFVVLLNLIMGLVAADIVVKDEVFGTFINLFIGFLIFILVTFVMITARNKDIAEKKQ